MYTPEIRAALRSTIFFNPDNTFVKWIAEYANKRIIIDIGCGSGLLLEKLRDVAKYSKTIGIEPTFDYESKLEILMKNSNSNISPVKILPNYVEDKIVRTIIEQGGDKILMVFARPCHNDFVENALSFKQLNTEALYITKQENIKKYSDLGKFEKIAKKIKHQGTSQDNEIVYSIK